MRKFYVSFIFLLGVVLFISCSKGVTPTNEDDKDYKKITLSQSEKEIVESGKNFGLKLFREIDNFYETENIFISPLSVSMALGMTLNGAANSTYDSICQVLEFDNLNNDEINKAYRHLIELLSDVDEKVLFEIANSIWYRNTFSVEKSFLDTNIEYFDAEISALNFADPASVDIINGWVSDKTHEKIKTIIDKISRDEVMFLINAIYFKGTWKYEFDKDKTYDGRFNLSSGNHTDCKMMKMQARLNYYKDDAMQVVELPYGNEHFNMLIFLPKNIDGLNEFIQTLDETQWRYYLSKLKSDSGTVDMPKFLVNYKLKMNDVLKSLGMANAFTSGLADFSHINKTADLFISRVIHKTFVQVDEEGTEAAAVTLVGIEKTSNEPDEDKIFHFYADHPFFYVIREKDSGTILFMGRMDNPKWEE